MKAKLWFKCAALNDPVCPKIISPCVIGWDAKFREVELVIEKMLSPDELVKSMKGWITVDPVKVLKIINKFGKFIFDKNGELFVELENITIFKDLKEELNKIFKDEIIIEIKERTIDIA